MKKMICLVVAMMVCLMLASPAFAAEDDFVPSISYKDGPEIEDAVMNDEDIASCVVVTSIKQAKDKSTDIYQESRDELLSVYAQLVEDEMKLDLAEGYIVRELVDVSFYKTDCLENAEHQHEEELNKPGVTIEITFDLGVNPATDLVVLSYHDGVWEPIVSVTNNGDGTVTGVFEHFCPVAFCVDAKDEDAPPATGDLAMGEIALWGGVMLVSSLMLVILPAKRRKESR